MGSLIQWPYGFSSKDVVGMGNTAFVARLDAVIKFVNPPEQPFLDREVRVYECLGPDCAGVLQYYGRLGNAIVLQYASNGSIREYSARRTMPIPLSLQLRWAQQITSTVAFIHSQNVLHGDLSCNNIFLDDCLNANLGDFAGSSINGEEPLICYETSHELPGTDDISIKSEIFALGSTFYEIMTGSKPFQGLSDLEIHEAFIKKRYPNLSSLAAFKDVIAKCWDQGYANGEELLKAVEAEGTIKFYIVLGYTLLILSS
jgi:serine/threonine protein kinase